MKELYRYGLGHAHRADTGQGAVFSQPPRGESRLEAIR